LLASFGLKVGPVTRKGFEARIRQLVTGRATLERIAAATLSARATLKAEYDNRPARDIPRPQTIGGGIWLVIVPRNGPHAMAVADVFKLRCVLHRTTLTEE
jgi:hypothetical protein